MLLNHIFLFIVVVIIMFIVGVFTHYFWRNPSLVACLAFEVPVHTPDKCCSVQCAVSLIWQIRFSSGPDPIHSSVLIGLLSPLASPSPLMTAMACS